MDKAELNERIREEIEKLSKAYTPEWKFRPDNPDIGTVIALIFAAHTAGTLWEYQRARARWSEGLPELLDLRPGPPLSARTVITMHASGEAGGTELPPGTRFFAETPEAEDPVIFQTEHPLYVTEALLKAVVLISGKAENTKVIPWNQKEPYGPLTLFPGELEGQYPNEVWIDHPFLFDGTEGCVRVQPESESPEERVYEADRLPGRKRMVLSKGSEAGAEEQWNGLSLSLKREGLAPDFLFDGYQEPDSECILPFGEEISLYREAWFGQAEVFGLAGAEVVMEFTLEMGRTLWGEAPEEKEDLKFIKRATGPKYMGEPPEVRVQEIRLTYYNGHGFRNLPVRGSVREIFAQGQKGRHRIAFTCPDDWAVMEVGGYSGRLLRMQVMKAENCYVRPSAHAYPILRGLTFRFDYRTRAGEGVRVYRKQGSSKQDITDWLGNHRPVSVFPPFPYAGEQVLFGFDKRFGGSPVSLYLVLEEQAGENPLKLRFEYLGARGFAPLNTIDHTDGLKKSGTVLFMVPGDMTEEEIEGVSAYWIRLVREGESSYTPVAEKIYMNGVYALNREQKPAQEYFLDEVHPGMAVPVKSEHLLGVRLLVNEGEEGFVEWKERERFGGAAPAERFYVLDRRTGTVRFPDGAGARMPECTDGLTFSVEEISCEGDLGNVGAGAVGGGVSYLGGITDITNPLPAYAGRGQEQEKDLCRRAAVLLKNGNRLVSEADYTEAVLAFSEEIKEAICRKEAGRLKVWVLLRDCERSREDVSLLFGRLKNHLLERGQMGGKNWDIEIAEPLFVKISVELWIQMKDQRFFFDTRQAVLLGLSKLFEPAMGHLPDEETIRRTVHGLAGKGKVTCMGIGASYADEKGSHETEFSRIPAGIPAVCINGEHHIHMEV